jgi:predicted transposase YdaD
MLDIAKATEALESYFATVSPEQFDIDLRKFCPELFEEEENSQELDRLTTTEVYQKAREDNKLEIAPKLLKKGLSIEEVADILELDVKAIASS